MLLSTQWKVRILKFVVATCVFVPPLWPQSPSAESFKRGTGYLKKGDYSHAIEAYTEAIRVDPGSAIAFHARGYAYYVSHDDDRAIQDFNEAIRLQPAYADAFWERGRAYEDKNDYDRAIRDYTEGLRLKPAEHILLYDRAFAYERKGEYTLAIADLNELVRRFPRSNDAYRDRALAYLYSGHPREAQQDISQAVELNPSGYYNVIWLYITGAKNGIVGAEDHLARNAAALNPTKWPGPVVQLFLGKSTPEAVLEAASDKDPDKSSEQKCEAHFYIGEYQAFHGRAKEARENFRLAGETCAANYFLYVPEARLELGSKK